MLRVYKPLFKLALSILLIFHINSFFSLNYIDNHLNEFIEFNHSHHDNIDDQYVEHSHTHKHSENGEEHEHNHDHSQLTQIELKILHERNSTKLLNTELYKIYLSYLKLLFSNPDPSEIFRPPISLHFS